MRVSRIACVFILTLVVAFADVRGGKGKKGRDKHGHRHSKRPGVKQYNWTTTLPSGAAVKESARVLPLAKIITITSQDVPSSEKFKASSTMMQFRKKKTAIKMSIQRRLIKTSKRDICFITDNNMNFDNTKRILEYRNNESKNGPLETGRRTTMVAGKRLNRTELRKMGFSIARFCKRAMRSKNVFELVPFGSAGTPENLKYLLASGLVSPGEAATPIPYNIGYDSTLNLFTKIEKRKRKGGKKNKSRSASPEKPRGKLGQAPMPPVRKPITIPDIPNEEISFPKQNVAQSPMKGVEGLVPNDGKQMGIQTETQDNPGSKLDETVPIV